MAQNKKEALKQARDERLDQLVSNTQAWAEKKKKQLNGELTLMKNLLKGRNASDRLNNTSVTSATDLLVDQINEFLAGSQDST